MTYRERRERKAEKLDEWAAKREERAAADLAAGEPLRSDWAFITQPGHIPERARMIARDERAFRSLDKAESMRSRAAGIEDQLAMSIYDDDPDAIEQLQARITRLEAERDEAKAVNAAYRKDHKAELTAMTPYERGQAVPYPSYHFQNLSGNLTRQRQRLARLERVARERDQAAASPGGVTVRNLSGGYVEVRFADKPGAEVRQGLRDHGFRWSKPTQSWVGTDAAYAAALAAAG